MQTFEVLTAVWLRLPLFWDMTLHQSVTIQWHGRTNLLQEIIFCGTLLNYTLGQ